MNRPHLSASTRRSLRARLLAWYDRSRRKLPWRGTRAPYPIWISEIMLQQTRVAAVLERYHVFLRRFPSVRALASAPLSAVLAAWSGLGYYRRARGMHAAARILVRRHGGRFSRTAEELRQLPGVGRYTAAAVASIAFGERTAVVDGNVERVLRRLLGKPGSGAHSELWAVANELLSRSRPGDFNQAMMELGATVCLPKAPRCEVCPLARCCQTRGTLASRRREPRRKAHLVYGFAARGKTLLLVRRAPNATLMPGMWELPEVEAGNGVLPGPRLNLRHSITTTDFSIRVIPVSPPHKSLAGVWVARSRLARLPLTGLTRKILQRLGYI